MSQTETSPAGRPPDPNATVRKSFLLRTFDRLHGPSDEYGELSGILSDGITVREVQALAYDLFNRVDVMMQVGDNGAAGLALLDGLRLQVQLLESMRKMAVPDDPADQQIGLVTVRVDFGENSKARASNRGPGVDVE